MSYINNISLDRLVEARPTDYPLQPGARRFDDRIEMVESLLQGHPSEYPTVIILSDIRYTPRTSGSHLFPLQGHYRMGVAIHRADRDQLPWGASIEAFVVDDDESLQTVRDIIEGRKPKPRNWGYEPLLTIDRYDEQYRPDVATTIDEAVRRAHTLNGSSDIHGLHTMKDYVAMLRRTHPDLLE